MVSVLSAQRDRFRAKAAQLEDQLTQVWLHCLQATTTEARCSDLHALCTTTAC